MFAWLYRLFHLLYVYWKFKTNRIPAPRAPEERLLDLDAELRSDLKEWDGEFHRLHPPSKVFIPEHALGSPAYKRVAESSVRLIGFRDNPATYTSDVSPGWHHVPNTSRWEPD